jgi:hypothetical protein
VRAQLFWFVSLNETWLITYNHSDISEQFVSPMPQQQVAAQSTGSRRRLSQGAAAPRGVQQQTHAQRSG